MCGIPVHMCQPLKLPPFCLIFPNFPKVHQDHHVPGTLPPTSCNENNSSGGCYSKPFKGMRYEMRIVIS